MMRTYRLVAQRCDGRIGDSAVIGTVDLGNGVCVDVTLRGDTNAIEAVGKLVYAWLNAGPFTGNWVDFGTDREQAVTYA